MDVPEGRPDDRAAFRIALGVLAVLAGAVTVLLAWAVAAS